jgi:hypothetical protein
MGSAPPGGGNRLVVRNNPRGGTRAGAWRSSALSALGPQSSALNFANPSTCGRLAAGTGDPENVLYFILFATAAALLLLIAAFRQHRLSQRDQAIRRLLDGADALEAQLLDCRARMQQLRSMLVALPEEMSADADAALTADDKVQAGLRDLLGHRLWIKQHAGTATRADLDTACSAIDQSRQVMHSQLARLDAITGELAAAQSSARSVAPRDRDAQGR